MMALVAVALISSTTFFRNIANFPLRNWDEAWYAEIIKNMATGIYGYLMPFWNSKYYFDHAPLYFWLSLPIVHIFGVGEWQVRLISALAAIASTILVFLIGKKVKDEKLGLLSTIIFLTMGQVVIRFAHGNLDSLLTALFLASFYFYLKSEKEQNVFASLICAISLGAGFLVKSWGVGLFPIFLIFVYSFIKNKSLPKNLPTILPVSLLVSLWWYAWGIFRFDGTFISWYLLNPSEGRLTHPLANFSFSYYQALVRDIGFWLIPALIALILKFKNITKEKNALTLSFIIASTVYISFLNFLQDKSDWYNIVAYPLIAITIAYLIDKIFEKYQMTTVLLIAIITLLSIYNVNRIENIYPDKSAVGANLGKVARTIIPENSTVILDDPNFTSFLYYSNQTAIYTLENNQKSEFTEWWKIKHENLTNFVKSHTNVWIITPNANNLPIQTTPDQLKDSFSRYNFLKLN